MAHPPKLFYILKIELEEIKPKIWRRLRVDARTSLFELHNYIQLIFPWKNYHLYLFDKNGVNFGDPRLIDEPKGGPPRST